MRQLAQGLPPESRILDIGAGAKPSLDRSLLPSGAFYVGLDVDEIELRKAPPGAYDSVIVGEIGPPTEALANSFDVVLCYRTLEHVRSLRVALASARAYLRPGGRFVAQTSGRYAGFAIANRLLPNRVSPRLLEKLTRRRADTVFPAHYDQCWYGALEPLLAASWNSSHIEALYYGAGYFRFFRPLLAAYIGFEEFLYRRRAVNLATHYILEAVR